ncbi:MAG: hypothetical protein ABEI27_06785 [Halobellus sp.]|uniref:hypothetical protein n=1 Tax=Halobellus sp. TaxID=1979212 RepID=UPI0035D4E841
MPASLDPDFGPLRHAASPGSALGLVYGSYRTARTGLPNRRHWRIGQWTVAGGDGFLSINVGLMLAVPPASDFVERS